MLRTTLDQLKNRIVTIMELVTTDMLERIWEEFDCIVSMCNSKGSHL